MRYTAGAVALSLVLLGTGCTSPEPRSDVKDWDRPAPPPAPRVSSEFELIRSLGLGDRPTEDLGAVEKTFNSCSIEPHPDPCATRFVTLIHFQLLCRDTEGTVQDAPVRPEPIGIDDLQWNVGELKGTSRTDDRGFGEIIALSDRSLLEQRLTLRMGPRFLGLTVGEITKVVLPNNFCQKR